MDRIGDQRWRSLLAAAAVVLAASGCGDEAPEPTATVSDEAVGTAEGPAAPPGGESSGGGRGESEKPPTAETGPAESAGDDPRVTALERAAESTVREYIEALNAGDGGAVCSLLAPGAIEQVELPRAGGGCAAALEASIGYRDPRGLPVWEGAELARLVSVETGDDTAKVVATVVTTFADRAEPSIEDDIVHLVRSGGRWLVAKPSSTLYRAVGIADVPPSVLAPPR